MTYSLPDASKKSRWRDGPRGWWHALPLFWRFQVAGWIAFVIGYTLCKAILLQDVELAVMSTLVQEPIAFGLTLCLYWLYRRMPTTISSKGIVAVVIAACIIAATIDMTWFATMRRVMYAEHELALPGRRGIISIWLIRVLVYACWSFLYFWVRAELTRMAAVNAANVAQLKALRAQLNPHFLFNALNSIAAEADDNPRAVKALARELASYLRYSLTHRHNEQVPLEAELEAMEHYLNVEKARFEERFHFSFETSPDSLKVRVPGFFLQPLIENAVKHGMQASSEPLRLIVRTACTADRLRIEVGNTGEWREAKDHSGPHGFGLASIRDRLALLYPGNHRFDIDHGNGWVNITLEVPRA
jgi:two-component system, LytTR family, sensor kinase